MNDETRHRVSLFDLHRQLQTVFVLQYDPINGIVISEAELASWIRVILAKYLVPELELHFSAGKEKTLTERLVHKLCEIPVVGCRNREYEPLTCTVIDPIVVDRSVSRETLKQPMQLTPASDFFKTLRVPQPRFSEVFVLEHTLKVYVERLGWKIIFPKHLLFMTGSDSMGWPKAINPSARCPISHMANNGDMFVVTKEDVSFHRFRSL